MKRLVAAVFAALLGAGAFAFAAAEPSLTTVTVDLGRASAAFRPLRALGAGLDGQSQGDVAGIYTRANIRAMRSSGLGALSYRLRTELGVEAWHWNPVGTWSDPHHKQGYWTSSARVRRPIRVSYGYRLPRRGNTIDQANDDGYSRLDDGDLRSFWKSNPYLSGRFTHTAETPQWVLVDLGRPQRVDALRIAWGAPYARRVRIEYWAGSNALFTIAKLRGRWRSFSHPSFAGRPGVQTLRVAARGVRTQFVRVLLARSSHTAPRGAHDVRDRLGFAIREISVGTARTDGYLIDLVRHGHSNRRQSVIYVSSTDPWHRAGDIDTQTEQPGIDLVLRSALARGQPTMVPVPVLYGTPADARAEVRYLHRRRYPLAGLELGEEPDGQLATPEDYGALYVEFAAALRRVDRRTPFGGPGYQTSIPDWEVWADSHGRTSWTQRFVALLRSRHSLSSLGFMSFEWYPVDDVCAPTAPNLRRAPRLLASLIARQRRDGLPRHVPIVMTEYGYSAFAGRPEVDMTGALYDAETVGRFLSAGGQAAYFYGYEPSPLIEEGAACGSWGNLALFQSDDNHRIRHALAAYWAVRLMTREWTDGSLAVHKIYPTSSDDPAIGAYAVLRPDHRLAILVVNKDPQRARRVRLNLQRSVRADPTGVLDAYELSSAQYVWHPGRDRGYPRPDRPPAHLTLDGNAPVTVPPYSVSVLRPRNVVTQGR